MKSRVPFCAVAAAFASALGGGCASLLRVDDVGYASTDAGAVPNADAEAGAQLFCTTVDASFCADFDEGSLLKAYLDGTAYDSVFQPPQVSPDAAVVIGTGPNGSRALIAQVPATNAGPAPFARLVYAIPTTKNVHLEMDVAVSVGPADVGGSLPIFEIQLVETPNCSFKYEYEANQAALWGDCLTGGADSAPFPIPIGPQHVVFDAHMTASGIQGFFSNGPAVRVSIDRVFTAGSFTGAKLELAGDTTRVVVPQASVTIDNVVMTFD